MDVFLEEDNKAMRPLSPNAGLLDHAFFIPSQIWNLEVRYLSRDIGDIRYIRELSYGKVTGADARIWIFSSRKIIRR